MQQLRRCGLEIAATHSSERPSTASRSQVGRGSCNARAQRLSFVEETPSCCSFTSWGVSRGPRYRTLDDAPRVAVGSSSMSTSITDGASPALPNNDEPAQPRRTSAARPSGARTSFMQQKLQTALSQAEKTSAELAQSSFGQPYVSYEHIGRPELMNPVCVAHCSFEQRGASDSRRRAGCSERCSLSEFCRAGVVF